MQEKIEDIKHIQYSLWGMYKDFLADKDSDRYKDRTNVFLNDCKEYLKYFCRNLIITYTAMIDVLTEDFKNGRDIEVKHEEIKHIQNTIWAMYNSYLTDHGMKKWNEDMRKLAQEYYNKCDEQLLTFCQHLLITWCPIINGFAEEFRNGNI